jgi:hypothetical protein
MSEIIEQREPLPKTIVVRQPESVSESDKLIEQINEAIVTYYSLVGSSDTLLKLLNRRFKVWSQRLRTWRSRLGFS